MNGIKVSAAAPANPGPTRVLVPSTATRDTSHIPIADMSTGPGRQMQIASSADSDTAWVQFSATPARAADYQPVVDVPVGPSRQVQVTAAPYPRPPRVLVPTATPVPSCDQFVSDLSAGLRRSNG